MTSASYDIAQLIRERFPQVDAFDSLAFNAKKKSKGCLIEQGQGGTVDALANFETVTLTLSVKEDGMGMRGSTRSEETAEQLYNYLKLIISRTINGREYCRIVATTPPYEVYSSPEASVWRFTLSVDRAIQGITWQ